jgi:hypothetical protein
MINLLAYGSIDRNYKGGSKRFVSTLIDIHIQNSLFWNWKPEELVVCHNLDKPFRTAQNILIKLKDGIHPSMFKWLGILQILKENRNEIVVYHDYDNFQVSEFRTPSFDAIGMVTYPKGFNTGLIVVNDKAIPFIKQVIQKAEELGENTFDEKVVRRLDKKTKDAVTILNSTYNVGRTAFQRRYDEAEKPIIFLHAHLEGKGRFRQALSRNLIPDNLKELLLTHIHKGLNV